MTISQVDNDDKKWKKRVPVDGIMNIFSGNKNLMSESDNPEENTVDYSLPPKPK